MAVRWYLLVVFIKIWASLEGAPTLSVDTPGNYSETWSLVCSDASYTVGNPYIWKKNGVNVFTNQGEQGTSGKYSKEESGRIFKLFIHDLVVNDEGLYKCNQNFLDSNEENLTVQAQANVNNTDANRDPHTGLLVFIFKNVYPAFSSAVITCKLQIAGSITSVRKIGDLYYVKWESSKFVPEDDISGGCIANLIGGYTNQTIRIAYIKACVCKSDDENHLITCGTAVGLSLLVIIILAIVLKVVGPFTAVVVCNLTILDLGVIVFGFGVCLYAVIVGSIAVNKNDECRNCQTCNFPRCYTNNALGISSLVLGVVVVVIGLSITIIVKRKGKRKHQNEGMNDEASNQEMMGQQNKTSL